MNGAGESKCPFSKYANVQKILNEVNFSSKCASPSTVTNIIILPQQANKKALKTYLREKLFEINHDIRSVLYKRLIKRIDCNNHMFDKSQFDDFSNQLKTSSSQISFANFAVLDVFPLNYLNDNGHTVLKKLLASLEFNFPQVTYSPMLLVSCCILLMYDDDPSQVFEHVCRLIFSTTRNTQYLDITEVENTASAKVLRDLSQKFAPGSHKSLLHLTSNPDKVYSQWLRCLFNALPFSYMVVLFDMYLLEGYKALYRVSLAILRYYRKSGISNAENVIESVFDFVKEIDGKVPKDVFFNKAFKFKLPSSKDIFKLHATMLEVCKKDIKFSTTNIKNKTRNPWNYLHLVKEVKSEIVDESLMSSLYCWIPEQYALNKPQLLFSTKDHGFFMHTFFSCVDEYSKTIILVKTTEGSIFGAFCSEAWDKRHMTQGYFGTGESFVFTLLPNSKIFRWVGTKNSSNKLNTKNISNIPKADDLTSNITLPPIETNFIKTSNFTQHYVSEEAVVLPPLVKSSMSIASSQDASSEFSSPFSNNSNYNLKNNVDLAENNFMKDAQGNCGTFEEIPSFKSSTLNKISSTNLIEKSSQKLVQSAEFSKENLQRLVEKDFKPSKRTSAVPEELPLTNAIESIFDSSKNVIEDKSKLDLKNSQLFQKISEESSHLKHYNSNSKEIINDQINIFSDGLNFDNSSQIISLPDVNNISNDSLKESLFGFEFEPSELSEKFRLMEVDAPNQTGRSSKSSLETIDKNKTGSKFGENSVKSLLKNSMSNKNNLKKSISSSSEIVESKSLLFQNLMYPRSKNYSDNESKNTTNSDGNKEKQKVKHFTAQKNYNDKVTKVKSETYGNISAKFKSNKQLSSSTLHHQCMKNTELFMRSDQNGLYIGGGKGNAIYIDRYLNHGLTQYCSTFNNEPLVSNGKFICAVVEVFSLSFN